MTAVRTLWLKKGPSGAKTIPNCSVIASISIMAPVAKLQRLGSYA